jgi:hypothetical protein
MLSEIDPAFSERHVELAILCAVCIVGIMRPERSGEDLSKSDLGQRLRAIEDNDHIPASRLEFVQHLTAGAAWRDRLDSRSGDRDGDELTVTCCDTGKAGCSLGAAGQPVAYVFYVGASDDFAIFGQKRSTYRKRGVWRVGSTRRLAGSIHEPFSGRQLEPICSIQGVSPRFGVEVPPAM